MEAFFRSIFSFLFLLGMTFSNTFGALRGKMNAYLEDPSDVTWAHAVNSWDALEKALASSVDFLEADVLMGHIGNDDKIIPVMAHPPDESSDLSLDNFLNTVVKHRSDKGLKLDFKSLEVLEPSLRILEKYVSKLNGSLWLSADVLKGPVNSPKTEVLADKFLSFTKRYFPSATLSLGWTTYWFPKFPVSSWQYEWKHVREMADIIRCQYNNNYPPITFSVRGIFASRSVKQLQWLLNSIPGSTLTVWNGELDEIDHEDFLKIQKHFSSYKVYYDVPYDMIKSLPKLKNDTFRKKKFYPNNDLWAILTPTKERDCETFTYTENKSLLFGRSSDIGAIQKKLLSVDADTNFTLTGRLRFFAGDHMLNPTHWEHKLKILLIDVRELTKNAISHSKKKMLKIKNPELIWAAANRSVLYTFEHQYFQDSSACRMFKMNIAKNISFEAWTIPCDRSFEDNTFDEVSKSSILEISLEEALDRSVESFIIGFHSYGEEFVLIYDLDETDQEKMSSFTLDILNQQFALTSSVADLTTMLAIFLPVLALFMIL